MSFLPRLIQDVLGTDRRPPNAYMWKGGEEPFYNRWWLKVNAADGDAYSLQIVVNNPWDTEGRYRLTGVYIFFDRYSADPEKNLMTMTDWPLSDFAASTERFEVSIAGNTFSETAFRGKIHDPDHDKDISFDLTIEKVHDFLLSDLGVDGMFRGSFFNTLWQAPMTDCRVSGKITIDDEVIELVDDPGYQDTFYGSSVPDRWFWGHCNKFVEDEATSLVIGAGQIEVAGQKIPRFLDTESFPVLTALHYKGQKITFNSILQHTDYFFDKGKIRLDTRRWLQGVRVVYESEHERALLRAMDWHSPDDTNLESSMALTAPATLKIYRKSLFGSWRLETTLTTPGAGSICGGAKMDRISRRRPLWRTLWGNVFLFFYLAVFFFKGVVLRRR